MDLNVTQFEIRGQSLQPFLEPLPLGTHAIYELEIMSSPFHPWSPRPDFMKLEMALCAIMRQVKEHPLKQIHLGLFSRFPFLNSPGQWHKHEYHRGLSDPSILSSRS